MARVTVKAVTIKGVDYIASIASNDDNNLRSAYLTPKFVVDANLDSDHPDFWNHINSEVFSNESRDAGESLHSFRVH